MALRDDVSNNFPGGFVLSQINFNDFIPHVMMTLYACVQHVGPASRMHAAAVVKYGMRLIGSCVQSSEAALSAFMAFLKRGKGSGGGGGGHGGGGAIREEKAGEEIPISIHDWIKSLLLDVEEVEVRTEVAIGITELCKVIPIDATGASAAAATTAAAPAPALPATGRTSGDGEAAGGSGGGGDDTTTAKNPTPKSSQSTSSEPSRRMLRVLLETLHVASSRAYNRKSEQFFRLVCALVRMQKRRSKELISEKARIGTTETREWDQRDFTLLLRKCLTRLRSHKSLEVFNQLPLYSFTKEFGSARGRAAVAAATALMKSTMVPSATAGASSSAAAAAAALAGAAATTKASTETKTKTTPTSPGEAQVQDHVLFGTLQMIRVIIRACPESLFPALSAGSGSAVQGNSGEDEEKKDDDEQKEEKEEKVASSSRQPRARRSNSSSMEAGIDLIKFILYACNFRGLLKLGARDRDRDREDPNLRKLGPKCSK